MTTPGHKNYIKQSFLLTALVVVILLCISRLPSFRIGAIEIERRSILSQLDTSFRAPLLPEGGLPLDSSTLLDAAYLHTPICPLPKDTFSLISTSWTTTDYKPQKLKINPKKRPKTARVDQFLAENRELVEIETFSTEAMSSFNKALCEIDSLDRPVRIAVLGDSFIEGDIFTADLRELLQKEYGGRGVGFVPFTSPVAGFRGSVRHKFEGYTTHNLVRKATITDQTRDYFSVAGLLASSEADSAHVSYQSVAFRDYLAPYNRAQILFINQQNSTIRVRVNDTVAQVFTPKSSSRVQEIVINSTIENLSIRVDSTAGFIGFGVSMENKTGVCVDNYSIRGNSGAALLRTNASINRQINALLPYDLVILQYGLNAMSPSMKQYGAYSKQLVKIINYVKECFPEASILLTSVSDVGYKIDGEVQSSPVVHAMIEAQQAAAQESGIAFWNLFEAMGGENSMVEFAKRHWAAKDYTHMRYEGGRVIAGELTKAISEQHEAYQSATQAKEARSFTSSYTTAPSAGTASSTTGFQPTSK